MTGLKSQSSLTRFAWLSIATAVFTIFLKAAAYWLTGSVGLLSDALESGVNLVAGVLALVALTVAAQPPDDEHTFGHAKAEYFSSGAEGILILFAAGTIGYSAIMRLLYPQPLEQVGIGLVVSVLAAISNWVVARRLLRAGREYRSITLLADGQHLLTDVWTSAGVIVGVAAVGITGWDFLDPVIALLVSLQILYAGIRLVRESALGLMDTALPPAELAEVMQIFALHLGGEEVGYHALRTRQSGRQRFLSAHVQVPGEWSVARGHALVEVIEADLRQALSPIAITIHLEPSDDPVSWADISLNRDSSN